MKVLLAVDGSKSALKAVDCMIEHAAWFSDKPRIELVTVHLPLPKLPNMGKVVGKSQIDRFYQDEGEAALAAAEKKLGRARIPYQARVLVGPVAETLVKQARAAGCDMICIGTRGMGSFGGFLIGSTATKVLQLADRPVLLAK